MNQTPAYTTHHPRWYRTRVSTYWWSRKWAYFRFIVRELTSIAVAYFVVLTLMQIYALRQGAEVYAEFQEWLRRPFLITLNAISLFFVLYHAITWFNLAPKAIAARFRGKRIPDALITASNYGAWLAVSAGLVWLLSGG
jgi:fumarate reductase subunit C